MTTNRKNELIAQLVNILSELIEANDPDQVAEVQSDAVEMLSSMPWRGNIRELRNVIERMMILCDDVITVEHVKKFAN